MFDTSHIIILFPSHLLIGGKSIPVYSRLPCFVPANFRAALPRAMANTGLEGRLREEHNYLWSEERHCL